MGKRSQLSQLKSALSQAGVTGKKRKRPGALDLEKGKKSARHPETVNPFDVQVTRPKHDVGGRKLKGLIGRPSRSKQAGLEQRKKTLLKEYEAKGHAGGIVDRRFGENDPTMTPEERMLERFIKEKQRASKGAVFNLGEEEDELTHYGQSLSQLDDFGDMGINLDDDEEETGQIDGEVVKKVHFGGFENEEDELVEGEPPRKKSKAEVMAEVMAKSKKHKLLRQMEREKGENLRHELDQEFDSMRTFLYATGSNSIPLEETSQEEDPLGQLVKRNDDFDQHVRELAFDKRAQPKDRTKTEEELALEAKEALEKAERRRQRRMLGEDDNDSSEDNPKLRRKRARHRGADDLDDDFHDEKAEWNELGSGLGEGSKDDKGSHSGDSALVGDDRDEECDSGGEGQSGSEDPSEGGAGEPDDLVVPDEARKGKQSVEELPYTFECPSSHRAFLDIVKGIADEDVPIVIHRIRTLYNPSLAPDNKSKLQSFIEVLVVHILYISNPPSPRLVLLSSLLPHLFALTRTYPIQSAESFIKKISLMHKNLKRGLSQGPLEPDARTWPGLAELLFLRTIGAIWPTSDLNHIVISPTRVLMGEYLGLGRVRSLRDIASGLFLCTLFLQFEELSKRLVPETLNFLANTILHLAPHGYKNVASIPGSFPCPDVMSDLCRPLSIDVKHSFKLTARKPDLVSILSQRNHDEQAKVDLLGVSFTLLGRFADMYKSLEAFPELFEPFGSMMRSIRAKKLPENLQIQVERLIDTIDRLLKFSKDARQPLRLQSHKPIPIPTYIPKFDVTTSSYLRHQDPDRERNEATKLRRQVKQERKGAIRELRKDGRFLTAVQQKKQAQKDLEYSSRMKRVFGSLESERAEEKAMEREKSRLKKRAGRT